MISSEGSALEVLSRAKRWHIGHGDCLELLKELPDNSVDAMVTDPPGGIDFMGRDWDNPFKYASLGPGAIAPHLREREIFIWWLTERMLECFRVMKPGAHALVWSIPRTSHWTGMAIENAGFEIIDQVQHLFSQGMGKSKSARRLIAMENCTMYGRHFESTVPKGTAFERGDHICACAYPETEWDGFGTGLAPSHEGWWLFRKPLEGTIAQNIEKWGTGVINIDASRIPVRGDDEGRWPKDVALSHGAGCRIVGTRLVSANPTWDTPERDTESSLFTGEQVSKVRHGSRDGEASAERRYTERGSASFARTPGRRRDAAEEVDVWECEDGCAVFALAEQGGDTSNGTMKAGTLRANRFGFSGPLPERVTKETYGDSGSVARYFLQLPCESRFVPFRYQAKPTRAEKDAGLGNFRRRSAAEATGSEEGQVRLQNARTGAGRTGNVRNVHPTTKGEEWMKYCARLVCPPHGALLDPFVGSGTTVSAALCLGLRAIGFELLDTDDEPHVSIARARAMYAEGARALVPRDSLRVDPG